METKEKQIQELESEITYLNFAYRQGNPQVADSIYDNLLIQLKELDPTNPILQKGIIEKEPTSRKRKLKSPMMSLDKCKSLEEIKKWLLSNCDSEDDVIVCTPKYNGISLEVDYADNTASTRGDGETGQNCDEHFKLMNKEVDKPFAHHCIGEAIISRENWDKHFKGKISPRGSTYKLNNATVAGLLNQDVPTDELKYVDFMKYGCIEIQENKMSILSYMNRKSTIKVGYVVFKIREFDEIDFDEFYEHHNEFYPIDGIVFEFNNLQQRFSLGRLSNGNPAYSKALKLDKWVEDYPTKITGYETTISKQGKLTGVVKFDPIIIEGTEVKQASFYNARFIKDFCLYPGANITVKKSGEIIPKIMSVEGVRIPRIEDFKDVGTIIYNLTYKKAKNKIQDKIDSSYFYKNLGTCPSCNNTLEWDETGNDIDLICYNPHCPSMQISKLEHFFTAIGVEEFGRPTITTLYENGYDTTEKIANISKEEFAGISGLGISTANTFCDQVDTIIMEGLPFARILYAYDVFEGKIGEKTCQLIIDSIERVIFRNNLYTIEDLIKIKGVSDITAECFLKGLETFRTLPILIPILYTKTPQKALLGQKFEGASVCFSGIRDKEVEEWITGQGGKVVSGVSKTTTHLIVADVNQSTSKTEKARELGCVIISLNDFKKL